MQAQIDLGRGKGGALTAHDFGTAAPTQAQLIEYACQDIWGAEGAFTFDSDDPAASAYVIAEVTHTASEIFNNTWVRNTYNSENHKWVLTSTPDTEPAVYIWTDVGQDMVMGATDTYAGVAKLYNGYEEDKARLFHGEAYPLGVITPDNMTSDSAPSPYRSKSRSNWSATYDAWCAFTSANRFVAGGAGTMPTGSDIPTNGEWWLEVDLGEARFANRGRLRSSENNHSRYGPASFR